MSRVFCPVFDKDLDKRKKHQPLCQLYKYTSQTNKAKQMQCRKCKIEYYKIKNPLLYKLIKGITYFAAESNYYFNGQTIPNNGNKYLIQRAKNLLDSI